MIRRPPRSTLDRSSAASDVYKRQLSYMVARRRREIGVRAALGAGRGDVIAIVWRRTMMLALTGLIVGSAGAFGVGRLLNSLLGGMPANLSIAVAVSWCAIAMASAMA